MQCHPRCRQIKILDCLYLLQVGSLQLTAKLLRKSTWSATCHPPHKQVLWSALSGIRGVGFACAKRPETIRDCLGVHACGAVQQLKYWAS
eukprot:scaffold176179_cov33-Tisochrysis_lutea.AAC.3